MVMGVERTVRALRTWRAVTNRFRLIMAIPAKRRIGTMVKWLGFLPCPMHGLILVQRNKLARATHAILQALAGETTVDNYRSPDGFLERLKLLLDNTRRRLYGLYLPLKSGQEISSGPATLVDIDDIMRTSLQDWVLALSTTAAPVSYALPRACRTPLPGPSHFFSSDAAKDGATTPGLAGYFQGLYWQFVYPAAWLVLPIAVLEFLALAISIITFAPLLNQARYIVIETDSLTTALVYSADAVKSPLLLHAHRLLLNTSEYTRLFRRTHPVAAGRQRARLLGIQCGRRLAF